jgi:hypothetical protein
VSLFLLPKRRFHGKNKASKGGETKLIDTAPAVPLIEESTGFPIPVAPDWDKMARRAAGMARLIDRHLDFEQRGKAPGVMLTPINLCPEQRRQLVADLQALTS